MYNQKVYNGPGFLVKKGKKEAGSLKTDSNRVFGQDGIKRKEEYQGEYQGKPMAVGSNHPDGKKYEGLQIQLPGR